MNEYRIRLNSTDSVNSVNKDNFVDVNLRQTTKLLPFSDIKETISQWTIYENERDNCNNYRLILTINPYCTNVLFNILTEIVKNEDDWQNKQVITDDTNTEKGKSVSINDVKGKKTPTRMQMLQNTEYSSSKHDFKYHCGYDIFNNHILRNKSFKLVNDYKDSTNNADVFNTIRDYLRDNKGKNVNFSKRTDISTINSGGFKHLYDYDDILNFTDSINANLTEDNGWFGFTNASTLDNNLNISRVINNSKNCEFIDMYPDRTLYSFNPKYNNIAHKPEFNWNVVITYPYTNFQEHPLIKNIDGDNKTNAIKIHSLTKEIGMFSDNIIMIRTYCKHGLKKNDSVYVYYSSDEGKTYTRSEIPYKVYNIGDINHENKDYFFSFANCNFADEIGGIDNLDKYTYRFTHYVNGEESQYYFRIFRKLPNLKFSKENLTDEISEDNDLLEDFLKNKANAYIKNIYNKDVLRNFDNEQYKLAFASNIYSDASTQITFTDTIGIEHIVDNLGRPLSELYITIIKNNRGYKEWYNNEFENPVIENSHCFGKLTCGLDYFIKSNETSTNILYEYAKMSNVHIINNMGCYNSMSLNEYYKKNSEIDIDDNEFIGDMVEFIPNEAKEVVLNDVYYRFNTAQRESIGKERPFRDFEYQEITADDYDLDPFTVTTYNVNAINSGINIGGVNIDSSQRPEGYYYKPHYKMQVRELGNINQDSHHDIRIKKAKPVQMDGIFIQMTSYLPSKVSINDTIYICDDATGVQYETTVAYVIDSINFVVNNIKEINWIKLCDILNSESDDMKFVVRRKNNLIPKYAYKVDANTYLWRDIRRVGDAHNTLLPNYPYANNHLYINKEINFFLKRQDPDGRYGLYCKDIFPNDVFGNIKPESNYTYKEETESTC